VYATAGAAAQSAVDSAREGWVTVEGNAWTACLGAAAAADAAWVASEERAWKAYLAAHGESTGQGKLDTSGGTANPSAVKQAGKESKIPILDNLPPDSTERHKLAQLLIELNMRPLLFPGGANVCHRWTEAARNIIVAHGKDWYINQHYTIEYIEWRFAPHGGWMEHGGLRISFANGSVAYLDDGELSGFIVSHPTDVPKGWTAGHIQSLDLPKGMPGYMTFYDLSVLWGLYW
jgi:hypothetical protein